MGDKLKNTVSPALTDGVLSWCEGDAFRIRLKIKLMSQGSEVDLDGYSAEVKFSGADGGDVHKFECEVENGAVTLDFTDAVSSEFLPGRYVFSVVVKKDGERSTVVRSSPAIVW